MTEKYNGWANRETWLINLWIESDPSLYEAVQEKVKEAKEYPNGHISWLADFLRDFFTEEIAPDVPGLYSDLLNCALERVEWVEIAEHLLTE